MRHTEKLMLTHNSGDLLYPVMVENKKTGKIAYRVVPFGGHKKNDLHEVEDVNVALDLVLNKNYSIRCSTLIPTITTQKGKKIKRAGLYSIHGHSIRTFTGHGV